MDSYYRKSKTSKPFVYFWEWLVSEERARERAHFVMKSIEEYHRRAKKVLEIGCGIGEVLVNLPEIYTTFGLDIEREYIEVCKRRMPSGKFFVSSMHNFKIEEKFDIIFSVYNSINFLENFAQWKSTLKTVNEHLDKDGLFIFDAYTPKMLTDTVRWFGQYNGSTSQAEEFPGGYHLYKGIVNGNTLTWDAKFLERLPNGLYELNEYEFKERIYSVSRMKPALSEHFDILETNLGEANRRIFFICRKKRSCALAP